ncbi:MAG: single-stranded DNA-binding protein [Bdellovibrionota bacterium]
MSSTNQVILTGNLGADPEVYKKGEGSAGVISFSIAENVTRLNEKTKKYEPAHTNWFPVRAFGGLGNRVLSGVKKGDRVTVFGKLRTYRYETPDGRMVSAFEVLADSVIPSGILPKGQGESRPEAESMNFNDFEA